VVAHLVGVALHHLERGADVLSDVDLWKERLVRVVEGEYETGRTLLTTRRSDCGRERVSGRGCSRGRKERTDLRDSGSTLPRDLVTARNVDNVDDLKREKMSAGGCGENERGNERSRRVHLQERGSVERCVGSQKNNIRE
jgi:hypothetical protein